VTASLNGLEVPEFYQLPLVGMAARLALYMRGAPPVRGDLLRQFSAALLQIPSTSFLPVVEILAAVEFVRLDTQGSTIRVIVPRVPYYEDVFRKLGNYANTVTLGEKEQLSLTIVDRLATGPEFRDNLLVQAGAEKKAFNRVLDIGAQGGYLDPRRARGRDLILSPIYFTEHLDDFADLAAGRGPKRVARVVALLSQHQGWPLSLILKQKRIGGTTLTDDEIEIVKALATHNLTPVPAITTPHAGKHEFVFSPCPGPLRITPARKHILEKAMAILAAVRQGQFYAKQFKIRWPRLIVQKLKDYKVIGANSEAFAQYRQLAIQHGVGVLEPLPNGRFQFRLIEKPENLEAVDLALQLLRHGEPEPAVDEEIKLSLRRDQAYIEALINRQELVRQHVLNLDPETASPV
jgi:hypothetical protein